MQLWYLKERLGFHRGRAGPAEEQWSLYKQRPFTNGRTSGLVLTDYEIRMEGWQAEWVGWSPYTHEPNYEETFMVTSQFSTLVWGDGDLFCLVASFTSHWILRWKWLFVVLYHFIIKSSIFAYIPFMNHYSNKFKIEGSTVFFPGIWCIKKKSWGNGC